MLFLLTLLGAGCTSLIAPASSNVGPQRPYNVYEVCISDERITPIKIGVLDSGGGGGESPNYDKPVAKSMTGQPIFENAIYHSDDGIFVMLPALQDDTDTRPRVFLFPIRINVTPDWSLWLAPAELVRIVPNSMDKRNFFTAPDARQLSGAPKIRWRTEPLQSFTESKLSGQRYGRIPSC